MLCVHKSAGKGVWFPSQKGDKRLHPYCEHCGVLKNISEDRGKKIGYFINALSEMRKDIGKHGSKLSDTQIRLIAQEFESLDYSDVYWTSLSTQRKIFAKIVNRYTNLSKNFVELFL